MHSNKTRFSCLHLSKVENGGGGAWEYLSRSQAQARRSDEDFFIVLHEIFAKRVEVSDIHCVKDAKVPLMMFKFEGISVDLPYAQLQVTTVPKNVDILNPLFLNGIDETSWKSLSGVRANNSILQLVPDVIFIMD
ncbi:hypothetical protein L1987_27973 [Smallanthus sonchifolius]|uniref:Uncharacterized protein n=1 Tax=Smallanthus sonchifolius TaxID=185202 RepID=A0ACB9IBR5_9ASTR|nr:hypothetical protein L1987_27973 [Smallanthus sonchifolius]